MALLAMAFPSVAIASDAATSACLSTDPYLDGNNAYGLWPAAGSVDTELRCLMELEVCDGETEVQPRVQA